MFTQLSSLTKAGLYYLLALGLSVGLALMMITVPGFQERWGESDIYMLTPILAILIMMFVVTRDGFTKAGWKVLGLHRLGLRSWPLAILAPIALLTCTYVLAWAFGIGRFDWSNTPPIGQILFLVVMQIIFSTTEEIGWRGYFLPHLLPLGTTRALLLSGFCHGLWHLPIMLMTPFYHASGNRILVASLFVLTLTAAGVFYGYVRLSGASLWPAVLGHTFVNATWAFWRVVTVPVVSIAALEYWAGESGVFSLIEIVILAGCILYMINRQGRNAAQIELVVAP
jgi:membrane protease YdiL (CAAX protease family)